MRARAKKAQVETILRSQRAGRTFNVHGSSMCKSWLLRIGRFFFSFFSLFSGLSSTSHSPNVSVFRIHPQDPRRCVRLVCASCDILDLFIVTTIRNDRTLNHSDHNARRILFFLIGLFRGAENLSSPYHGLGEVNNATR